jgi:hypothetical protein
MDWIVEETTRWGIPMADKGPCSRAKTMPNREARSIGWETSSSRWAKKSTRASSGVFGLVR